MKVASPSSEALAPRLARLDGGRLRIDRAELPGELAHEELVVQRGPRSGALMAVAIHDTGLGPALGGVRLWRYPEPTHAIDDVLRLAEAMTLKAAAAGLDLGGGKGVICVPGPEPPEGEERRRMLLDFGDLVESLEGRYITAEDIGTTADDMDVIAERTRHVTGRPRESGGVGDPSPFTAIGVEAAMRAACARAFGSPLLPDRKVTVIGVGQVGSRLALSLASRGVRLVLSDIDESKRELADELGAEWAPPERALTLRCDVLAPCAVGGLIDAEVARRLRCRVICGAANNQLTDDEVGALLARRGIVYAPDFIANAGGLISCYGEIAGYDADRARALALGIEDTIARVLAEAARARKTPVEAARELAERRLAGVSQSVR